MENKQHNQKTTIAFFVPSLAVGGAEKVAVNLVKGLSKFDLRIVLLLCSPERSPLFDQLPTSVEIVYLSKKRVVRALFPLVCYLIREQPDVLLSSMNYANVVAALASKLARVFSRRTTKGPRVYLIEQTTLSIAKKNWKLQLARLTPYLARILYPGIQGIIACSEAVALDLKSQLKLNLQNIRTIYNPVVDSSIPDMAVSPIAHPWFTPDAPPVFVSLGRLAVEKDLPTLLRAFSVVRKRRECRLLILGKGALKEELEAMVKSLNLEKDVELPGYVENPYAYIAHSAAFVLSSRFEGLPGVLIEAMACGCQIISTNCPSGPEEILENGRFGTLVPVGDSFALAEAMERALHYKIEKDILQKRALDFSVSKITSAYMDFLKLPQSFT